MLSKVELLIAIRGGDCQRGGRCDIGMHCRGSSETSPFLDKVRQCHFEISVLDLTSVALARSGKKLEGGDEKVTGDTMTLLRVTPEEAGVYICTASNQHSRLFSLVI